jgi:glycosyltransferase involved in cell wall biosynthesis
MDISIIIPTFNRDKQLDLTLKSLSCLNFKDINYEIIVIDNGSTDNTKIIARQYFELTLKYYYDPIPGLLTGRHRGASEAKGNYLTFIDDDVEVCQNWLQDIVKTFKANPNIHLLTGPTLPKYETYPPNWVNLFWEKLNHKKKYCAWLSLLDLGENEIDIDPNFVWGLNFSIRRDTFIKLNGFNPDNIPKKLQQFQGDGETGLTQKAKSNKLRAVYHPGVMLYHLISKDRLTKEYFGQRAFYQGVADSYTDLRNDLSVNKKLAFKFPLMANMFLQIKNFVTFLFSGEKSISLFLEAENVRRFTALQYKSGYMFHQEKYFNSSIVKEWVHSNNYLNYQIPVK